jgi:hypothetical protein
MFFLILPVFPKKTLEPLDRLLGMIETRMTVEFGQLDRRMT